MLASYSDVLSALIALLIFDTHCSELIAELGPDASEPFVKSNVVFVVTFPAIDPLPTFVEASAAFSSCEHRDIQIVVVSSDVVDSALLFTPDELIEHASSALPIVVFFAAVVNSSSFESSTETS